MAGNCAARGSIIFLIASGVALLCALGPTSASSGAGQPASIALLAVDGDISGNDPRTVASVEDCVSTSGGQPVDIDIVLPGPGIPADRGIAAYQFTILYDPAVVWIGADDGDMLLGQAAGSNVIPLADPKPDKNGVYQSWGVDFGPSGIEPSGASETGPGVIAGITLLPQSDGVSALILSNVLVIDDDSERISLESLQPATIHVGQPCSEPAGQPTPSPTVSTLTPSPATSAAAAAAAPTPATATPLPSPNPAGAIPTAGGAPPPAGGTPTWFVLSGILAALGGVALLTVGKLAIGSRARGDNSPAQD